MFLESAIGRKSRKIGRMVEMAKVVPLTKNHKDYEDVPDGLEWDFRKKEHAKHLPKLSAIE